MSNNLPVRYEKGSQGEISVQNTRDSMGNLIRLGDTVSMQDGTFGTVVALTLSPNRPMAISCDTCQPVPTYDFGNAHWVASVSVTSDNRTSCRIVREDVQHLCRKRPAPEYDGEHHLYSVRDIYYDLDGVAMTMCEKDAENLRRIMRRVKMLL